ncbi:winged helix DNA-binding domain-containing protein [Nocardia yunnanensis]|uniref:Winged helix DNA-binding domain-containing protein n=1 Tax=Nocardia yunnanensis TaxID=2382165 RepID=A0A386Z8W4_9NOCA|nr:winged helix DNA-binding domain-containing protein [Nocardia yunnanensis]AYF74080.1 winged helix DNA-binding domain-containing protein [Nocardia yunnanensis]
MPELSLRTLNRTLLLRQKLNERAAMPAAELVRHLLAVQGQEPNWPYIGLWARLTDFRHEDLVRLLQDRTVVRATTIRRTVHLSHAADYRWLYPTVRPAVEPALRSTYLRDATTGLDIAELATAGKELLAGRTVARRDLGKQLAARFPGREPSALVHALGIVRPLLHDASAGAWGAWRGRSVAVSLAEEWLDAGVDANPQPETLIRRYLAAYGPATVADIQEFAGVTRLAEVVTRLRPELAVYRDESGRELFDLPDAPIADPDLPAPVRFLPAFDNSCLGHRDRRRIIGDTDRARIAKIASGGVPFYLVDGFVHGRWDLDGSTIRITPWHPLSASAAAAVRAEAERLLPILVPDAAGAISIRS